MRVCCSVSRRRLSRGSREVGAIEESGGTVRESLLVADVAVELRSFLPEGSGCALGLGMGVWLSLTGKFP